jgi:hypothetical protein
MLHGPGPSDSGDGQCKLQAGGRRGGVRLRATRHPFTRGARVTAVRGVP